MYFLSSDFMSEDFGDDHLDFTI